MSRHADCHLKGNKKTKIPVSTRRNTVVPLPPTAADMAKVQGDLTNLNIKHIAIRKTVLEMKQINSVALASFEQNLQEMKAQNVRGNNHFDFNHRVSTSILVTIAEMASVQDQVQMLQMMQNACDTKSELEGASATKERDDPKVRGCSSSSS